MSSGRKATRPGSVDWDSNPSSPLAGLRLDDTTVKGNATPPESSSPTTKDSTGPTPSPSAVLTEVLSAVAKQSNEISAVLSSENEFLSEPVLSGVLRRKASGAGAVGREGRSVTIDSLQSYPFSAGQQVPSSSVAVSLREATNRAIISATGNEVVPDDGALVANFNHVETKDTIPSKDATTQCNFCLRRIKMSEVQQHLRSCPVRKEPCKHCGEKVSVIRMEVHIENECVVRARAQTRDDDVYTPYSLSRDEDDDDDGVDADPSSIKISDIEEDDDHD
jgi:hypothetical protein